MSSSVSPAAGAMPRSVLVYGLLGLVPFVLPPLLGWWSPAHADLLVPVMLAYGALILSFLGGARWGIEVARPLPGVLTVSLAMLPTLAGLALLLAPGLSQPERLGTMAALLALQFGWDLQSRGLPAWYPRLRGLLTLGAVAGLVLMAVVVAAATPEPAAVTV